ncbi:MAG: hypothetical protein C0485_18235 [Pirellula sp.]|nr:hypothetical protein [Pirellula sp.]
MELTQRHQPSGECVDAKIQSLLNRVEQLRRGVTIDRPTKFSRAGEQHAREVARRDSMREVEVSLQRTEATQITTTQNAMPTLPARTTSPHSTHRSAIHNNAMPFDA